MRLPNRSIVEPDRESPCAGTGAGASILLTHPQAFSRVLAPTHGLEIRSLLRGGSYVSSNHADGLRGRARGPPGPRRARAPAFTPPSPRTSPPLVGSDCPSRPSPAPAATIPATLAADLAPDPLDASWVGMPLPTLYPMTVPTGNVEFQGKLILAGNFVGAGSVMAHGIVSWDGTQFGSVGNPG